MSNTVEQTHNKIISRVGAVRKFVAALDDLDGKLRQCLPSTGKNAGIAAVHKQRPPPASMLESLCALETRYKNTVTPALNDYYSGVSSAAAEYNKIIMTDNFASLVEDQVDDCGRYLAHLQTICTTIKTLGVKFKAELAALEKQLAAFSVGCIEIPLEKVDTEICKCGARMTTNAEESKMMCPNPYCLRIKTLVGVVFRDDQFYTQDGQKSKHNGYDTSRHYRFWIDRLQAREIKTFSQEELDKINYIIDRDRYNRNYLQCRDMRTILKDPKVKLTSLNDHVPLLIKICGGQAPPQLTYQEDQMLSTRFDNVMRLYDIVRPDGGNKPYYPYFIYKLVEYAFKGDREKLRLLNYIHLQSRETIIKNDNTYKEIAALSSPEDGIVYTPTVASGRF